MYIAERATLLGEPIAIRACRQRISLAFRWSTTGRRAICSRGSISRWGRFLAQELRDQRFAVGGADGCAGAVSRCGALRGRADDPAPLIICLTRSDQQAGAIDMTLEGIASDRKDASC